MSLQINNNDVMLEISDLSFGFPRKMFEKKLVYNTIRHVSMEIKRNHCYGLIGESTCGKTTFGKLMTLSLSKIDGGYIKYNNRNIFEYKRREAREYQKRAQMIYQNPDASLNPGMRVIDIVAEAVELCPKYSRSKKESKELAYTYLDMVNLADKADNYPDILSGGEKRRIAIIRALAIEPDLIVADEPFSSLDASIRNEMLCLLLGESRSRELTYLFILHDIDIARYACETIAVMYMGQLVEIGKDILSENVVRHPYTDMLLMAQNQIDSYQQDKLYKQFLFNTAPRNGCSFRDRCFLYLNCKELESEKSKCDNEIPELRVIDENHKIACHFRT